MCGATLDKLSWVVPESKLSIPLRSLLQNLLPGSCLEFLPYFPPFERLYLARCNILNLCSLSCFLPMLFIVTENQRTEAFFLSYVGFMLALSGPHKIIIRKDIIILYLQKPTVKRFVFKIVILIF